MTLFDDITRSDRRPARENEPLFNYYNTSGRHSVDEIRTTLEIWFQRIPDSAKKELRARFRSHTDLQHQSAFFEIYLHELICCMGFSIKPHPNMPGDVRTHPDFVILRGDMPCFYLEATLAAPSGNKTAENARINEVYDTLNKMDSPNLILCIRLRGAPATPPPGARLRKELTQWLSRLDPDMLYHTLKTDGCLDGLPSYDWSHDGWDLSFLPIAKSPDLRGKPGVRPISSKIPEIKQVTNHISIKTAIGEKATKYGDLDLPFVVAVNVIDKFADDFDVMNALFGELYVTFTPNPDGTHDQISGREKNGALLGPQGPQNTRVSAVLILSNMNVWNMASQSPKMFHNPLATRPLSYDLLPLPQMIPTENLLEFKKGLTSGEILDLPKPWPPAD